MICFPGCKINLGLNVLAKREDGYHTIQSVLYPIAWQDILEVIKSDIFQFSSSGLDIPGDQKNNLCVQAYELLRADYDLTPVKIHLHKIIPMGGGLGGGSSDGAYTLLLLNDLFELNLSEDQLCTYAARLGSDCPFFIRNHTQYATETGTTLTNIALDLKGYYIKLLNIGVHVSTAEAYGNIQFLEGLKDPKEVVNLPMEDWRDNLTNSFEASVFPNHPELAEIKEELYKEGAVYAAMTGSGSTMFGIYKEEPKLSFDHVSFEKVLAL
ncbi:4-diphosphocytidyl-2-C-methyl-D-erythritol kinase [Lishizhenia tianjinensis]|uniref:4-diphosphocytidyl-2-C-methyl-D-erythritol kinase n=1 Tax=Lishizhenia tianjinensis TaxID=477690 RepID=A0A1I7AR99_9FLAO|nr:4-(cytidine 5'-diphospho)-2-C-methyl-D-erythritol kinase [Lishizhenia tianjinensis]SFT77442.1 4-diphosphocytidyl-2-C-methyl-D-erythritol kinase [Lishizhenia tianjinensis]